MEELNETNEEIMEQVRRLVNESDAAFRDKIHSLEDGMHALAEELRDLKEQVNNG